MTITKETIQQAYAVLNSLDGLASRFSLSKLGMSDTDFEAAKQEADLPPGSIEYLEAFGVAAQARATLVAMGWTPPR